MIVSALFNLILVLVVMGLFVAGLRFLQQGQWRWKQNQGRRLRVVETLYLDPKTRIVIVARDDALHTILLSAQGVQVIESNIPHLYEVAA